MSDLIQICIFLVISGQLYFIYKTYKADHERRRKQYTIEYTNKIRHLYRPIHGKLIKKFGNRTINLTEMDDEIKMDTEEILSVLEHLSVGINTNVYDFEILNRMSGRYLQKIYEKFLPFIKDKQENYFDAYIEFQEVYNKIEDRKSKVNDKGNLKFS